MQDVHVNRLVRKELPVGENRQRGSFSLLLPHQRKGPSPTIPRTGLATYPTARTVWRGPVRKRSSSTTFGRLATRRRDVVFNPAEAR